MANSICRKKFSKTDDDDEVAEERATHWKNNDFKRSHLLSGLIEYCGWARGGWFPTRGAVKRAANIKFAQ